MTGNLLRSPWMGAAVILVCLCAAVCLVVAADTGSVRTLLDEGRYAEAESAASRLLAEAESAPGTPPAEVAGILDLLVESLLGGGKATEAATHELARRAVALKEKALGPEHAGTATSLGRMGTVLFRSGDYAAAESAHLRALAVRERVLGPDHPDVAASLNDLAGVRWEQDDYAEARRLMERCLRIREQALGPNHSDTATSRNNLGMVLKATGDLEGARALYERALAVREEVLGPDHPDVAASQNNLAGLLEKMGEREEARALYERALAIQEKALGPEHPDVAMTLNNLGLLLKRGGDYEGALALGRRALAIWEKRLGPEHPDVAIALNVVASLMKRSGDHTGARAHYERALAIRVAVLGPEHSGVAAVLNNLAIVCWEAGDYLAARVMYERALAVMEKVYGPGHERTSRVRSNLAILLKETGDYEGAREILEGVLAARELNLGPDHTRVATALSNLAGLLRRMGEFSRALEMWERARAIWTEALGPEHPEVLAVLGNLALLAKETGDYATARTLGERVLAVRERTLGPEHAKTAGTLNNLAGLYEDMGERDKARALYERALAAREKALGPEHPDTGRVLCNLSIVRRGQGDLAEARQLNERCLGILEEALGPEHASVASALDNLALVLERSGDLKAAARANDRALAIKEKALGPLHPKVAGARLTRALLLAESGRRKEAFEEAVLVEEASREHLSLTARGLSERQALRYASVRDTGLDLALSLCGEGAGEAGRAWDALVRSRALVLDEMAGRRAGGGEVPSQETRELNSSRRRLADLLVRGPGEGSPEEYREQVAAARDEMEKTERVLARESAAYRQREAAGRAGLEEVAAALPEGWALAAFARYGRWSPGKEGEGRSSGELMPSYLAFVLPRSGGGPVVVPLGRASEIDALVTAWAGEVTPRGSMTRRAPGEAEAAYREVGEALRRAVWDPLAASLEGAEGVFLVPAGTLHMVAFAALPVGEDRYLFEEGPMLHHLSAERDLVALREPEAWKGGLLALGGPAFDEPSLFAALERRPKKAGGEAPVQVASLEVFRGTRSECGDFRDLRFEPLPGSRREAREVTGLWKQARRSGGEDGLPSGLGPAVRFEGAAASEAAFKENAQGKRVLHLATHGFFLGGRCPVAGARSTRGFSLPSKPGKEERPPASGENPLLLSGLAFAGANHREAAVEGEEDGVLTAEEIAALDLSGVEWAVLSGCGTGLGRVQDGEGVLGLRRAFQVAGAGTLIMSLWEVDDRATREWMRALYQARFLEGLGTAGSMRRASKKVLKARRAKGESTHPFYWAGFVAAGNWR